MFSHQKTCLEYTIVKLQIMKIFTYNILKYTLKFLISWCGRTRRSQASLLVIIVEEIIISVVDETWCCLKADQKK